MSASGPSSITCRCAVLLLNHKLTWAGARGQAAGRRGTFSHKHLLCIRVCIRHAQVRLDFSDLRERLDWAAAHDAEAHAMGDAARRVAHRRLRYQDMQARWVCKDVRHYALAISVVIPWRWRLR